MGRDPQHSGCLRWRESGHRRNHGSSFRAYKTAQQSCCATHDYPRSKASPQGQHDCWACNSSKVIYQARLDSSPCALVRTVAAFRDPVDPSGSYSPTQPRERRLFFTEGGTTACLRLPLWAYWAASPAMARMLIIPCVISYAQA